MTTSARPTTQLTHVADQVAKQLSNKKLPLQERLATANKIIKAHLDTLQSFTAAYFKDLQDHTFTPGVVEKIHTKFTGNDYECEKICAIAIFSDLLEDIQSLILFNITASKIAERINILTETQDTLTKATHDANHKNKNHAHKGGVIGGVLQSKRTQILINHLQILHSALQGKEQFLQQHSVPKYGKHSKPKSTASIPFLKAATHEKHVHFSDEVDHRDHKHSQQQLKRR